MSYQSPIDIIMHDMQMKTEDEICKAVQKVGINVDKDELIRALQYDRKQYEKGYADRDAEIIKCKDCKHCVIAEDHVWRSLHGETLYKCEHIPLIDVNVDWYCADGERKEGRC